MPEMKKRLINISYFTGFTIAAIKDQQFVMLFALPVQPEVAVKGDAIGVALCATGAETDAGFEAGFICTAAQFLNIDNGLSRCREQAAQ